MIPFPIRIDADSLPALLAGAMLLAGAAALGLKQWWAHRRLLLNPKVNEPGYQIVERQIRQRLIVAGLMFALGVAIPAGDQLGFVFLSRPGLFFAYWMGVLLLVFAMIVVAMTDALSTLAYARVTQVDLRRERHQLEEEIRRFRASRMTNSDGQIDTETQPPDSVVS